MSSVRPGSPGATRTCPHCRATILESANVCPACRHHLRFDSAAQQQAQPPARVPLRVEGTIRYPEAEGAWEYTVVVSIRNGKGEEIRRQVIDVGAMQRGDERSFILAVEATEVRAPGRRGTRH